MGLKSNQSGNVLFMILIVVALFAALSYAVINSDRVSYKTIDDEEAKLDQAVSENCEANVNMAKTKLEVLNSCTADEMNYVLPSGLNANPNARANGKCDVFYPGPGGATPCGIYLQLEIANPDSEFENPSIWNTTTQGTGWVVSNGKLIGTNTTGQALTNGSFTLDTSKTYTTEVQVNSIGSGGLNIAFFNPGIPSHRLVPTITSAGTYFNNDWSPATATQWLRITPTTTGQNYEIEYIRIYEKNTGNN